MGLFTSFSGISVMGIFKKKAKPIEEAPVESVVSEPIAEINPAPEVVEFAKPVEPPLDEEKEGGKFVHYALRSDTSKVYKLAVTNEKFEALKADPGVAWVQLRKDLDPAS